MRAAGGEITVMGGVDLGDADAARDWVDAAVATYDGIDVLYNNASTQRFAALDELTVEEWDFTMRNELDLVYYTVRAAWPHLKAHRRRLDPQRRLDRGDPGRGVHAAERALDGQGRRHRADPPAGRRGRPARHPRQRDQPRPGRDPEHRADAGRPARAAAARSSSTGSRWAGTASPRTSSTRRIFLCLRRGVVDQRRAPRRRRRRLGPRLTIVCGRPSSRRCRRMPARVMAAITRSLIPGPPRAVVASVT